MKFKMIIVASLALGAQFASAATTPSSNCAANANKQTISQASQENSERTVNAIMKVAQTKEAAPAAHGTR
jgi:hypothetical protein